MVIRARRMYQWVAPAWIALLLALSALPVAAAGEQALEAGRIAPLEQAPIPKPGRGGGSEPGAADEAEEAAEILTDEVDTALAVTSLDDVVKAVVQIEAVGAFADPTEGMMMNVAGRGSGFIIDPSGIAVTNNHVVTGAAFLKVFVAGEDKPRNARVLGVSECADLAVIDIQGDGFHYLNWSAQPIKVGLDIYAAGFPLGDPEYTLTRGIIAKANANGESSWASVRRVIQHDAATNPGNSGGPIVDKEGGVIAVHYAGNGNTNQYFAIAMDEALPVLDELRAGRNVDSIGINGEAVTVGDELTGIWVASVASGSIADNVGIKPGDVLISMEGVSLALQGDMREYCDILRSHTLDDVMAIQVLRLETGEVLEGRLNGRPLQVSFSLAQQIEEKGEEPERVARGDEVYEEFVTISDDTGLLSVEAPAAWADLVSGPWVSNDKEIGVRLMASTDVQAMTSGWDTPGLFFGVSASLAESTTTEKLLDGIDYKNACTYGGREAIPDGYYTGHFDVWSKCGAAESTAIVAALLPQTEAYLVLLEIYAVTDADLAVLDRIVGSFVVNVADETADAGAAGLLDAVDTTGLVYTYGVVSRPALTALMPKEYGEIQAADWVVDDEVVGTKLTVAPSVDKFNNTWTAPGVYVRTATDLTEEIDIDEWLDSYDLSDDCKFDERIKHTHTINGMTYVGAFDLWTDCNGSDNLFAHLVAVSDPAGQLVIIDFQAIEMADAEAWQVLLQSFYVGSGEATNSGGTAEPPVEYVAIGDDSGSLTVRVPADWSDVNGATWAEDDETIGFSVSASPDLEAYNATWTMPGMFFGATAVMAQLYDAEEMLNQWDYSNDCSEVERFDYDDGVYAGPYDIYSDCGGEGNVFVVLAAAPKAVDGILVLLQVSIPAGESADPFEQILASFHVEQPDNLFAQAGDFADESATADVLAATLNVRAGPGVNYNRIAAVNQGDQLTVVGQVDNCAWLQIRTPNDVAGWVSGSAQYVQLNGNCRDIRAAEAPPPPRTTTSGNTGSAGNTGSTSSGAPAATNACITFRNNIGAELNITFTRTRDNWNKTFKVAGKSQHRECFDPGRYTLTVDAPPPWGSFNDDLDLKAGDNFPYDVNPGN